jgi:hypothetical protein
MENMMFNGRRILWDASIVYKNGKESYKGRKYHRVCPSYKHFSAITNNGFVGIAWVLLIPTVTLVVIGILSIVYLTWVLGIICFLLSLFPEGWLIKRYYDSTPYKWETSSELFDIERAFHAMPMNKQHEYRHFLDKSFKGTVARKEVLNLFKQYSELDAIDKALKDEIAKKRELDNIMAELGVNFES